MTKVINRMIIKLIFIIMIVSFVQFNVFSIENKDNAVKSTSRPMGLKPISPDELKTIRETWTKATHVRPNSIGLLRINETRKKRGLNPIDQEVAVPFGQEVVQPDSGIISNLSTNSRTANTILMDQRSIPSSVDNSQQPFFPPIGDQGNLGSCQSFASTYYQLTYMNALKNGYDPNHLKIFSPKWTYNFINQGSNNGGHLINLANLFKTNGCATWDEFPYVGDSSVVKNYTEWPILSSIWTDAINYRIDQFGYVDIGIQGENTPITSPTDDGLNDIKQMLNNGYILSYETYFNWDENVVSNDPATSADDNYVAQKVYYRAKGETNGHVMVVVGYNDNIWTDINGNGVVDAGEKGAFKVANSWGPVWGNQGFAWLAYDALNKISSVIGANDSGVERVVAFSNDTAYWIIPKSSYVPKILALVTLNHAKRNQLNLSFGYSDVSVSAPTITWKPFAVNYDGGAYAFDGTTTACDGYFTFDLTDLDIDNSLNDGNPRRWYLKITDNTQDGNPAILKGFSLFDVQGEQSFLNYYPVPLQADGTSILTWIDCSLSVTNKTPAAWTIGPQMTDFKKEFVVVSLNNKIYTIGGYDKNTHPLNCVNVLNTLDNKWSSGQPMPNAKSRMGAATLYGKIYVVGGYGPPVYNTLDEYTPETNQWTSKTSMDYNKNCAGATSLNNKLYVSSRINGDTNPVNRFDEYDPVTDTWKAKANMLTTRDRLLLASANNKIYAFGGIDSNSVNIKSIEEYDPMTDKWTAKSSIPNSISWLNSAVTINDKIYLSATMARCTNNYTVIFYYDPLTDAWTYISQIPTLVIGEATMAELNGKIYVFGGGDDQNQVNIYNPNWTSPPTPTPAVNISLQMYNRTVTSSTNTINPIIKLFNNGTTAISLSNVKIRYYYTIDGEQPQTFTCDWSTIGMSNVTGTFTKLATPKTGADYYLEVGFTSGAGTLQPGSGIEIQTRFSKNNWANYTQAGDYSYISTATNFVNWTKITGYFSGSLKWGTEP